MACVLLVASTGSLLGVSCRGTDLFTREPGVFLDLAIVSGSRKVESTPIVRLDLGTSAARPSLAAGWSVDEHQGDDTWVWALGRQAEIQIELDAPAGSCELVVDLKAAKPRQVIRVLVNGEDLGTLRSDTTKRWRRLTGTLHPYKPNIYRLSLPAGVLVTGLNNIQLRFSSAGPTPTDNRAKAAAFRLVEIRPHGTRLILDRGEGPGETLASSFTKARVSWFVYLPPDAELVFGLERAPSAEAFRMEIQTTREGQPPVAWPLGKLATGSQEHRVDLSPTGGAYVTLEISAFPVTPAARGEVRLVRPRIQSCAKVARPNLLLISVDSLRYDHLGFNGYDHPTTPNLDAVARESVVFDLAIAQSSWTLPSLISLLTGRYPGQLHHLPFGLRSEPAKVTTLAEVLSANGYHTIGVTSHWYSSNRFGLGAGFQVFDDHERQRQHPRYRTADGVVAAVRNAWMRRPQPHPVFTWVHIFEPHWPYLPTAEHVRLVHPESASRYEEGRPERTLLRASLGKYWPHHPDQQSLPEGYMPLFHDASDGYIRRADDAVGEILALWRQEVDPSQGIVVITSDHGEAIDEGGWCFTHAQNLHQELVHVPLLVRYPGKLEPRRVGTPVALGGLAPTLLQLAGLPGREMSQWWSMPGFFEDPRAEPLVSELHNTNEMHRLPEQDQVQYSVIRGAEQTILYPRRRDNAVEVFSLQQPKWTRVAAAEESVRRMDVLQVLAGLRFVETTPQSLDKPTDALSSEQREQVRSGATRGMTLP